MQNFPSSRKGSPHLLQNIIVSSKYNTYVLPEAHVRAFYEIIPQFRRFFNIFQSYNFIPPSSQKILRCLSRKIRAGLALLSVLADAVQKVFHDSLSRGFQENLT